MEAQLGAADRQEQVLICSARALTCHCCKLEHRMLVCTQPHALQTEPDLGAGWVPLASRGGGPGRAPMLGGGPGSGLAARSRLACTSFSSFNFSCAMHQALPACGSLLW